MAIRVHMAVQDPNNDEFPSGGAAKHDVRPLHNASVTTGDLVPRTSQAGKPSKFRKPCMQTVDVSGHLCLYPHIEGVGGDPLHVLSSTRRDDNAQHATACRPASELPALSLPGPKVSACRFPLRPESVFSAPPPAPYDRLLVPA